MNSPYILLSSCSSSRSSAAPLSPLSRRRSVLSWRTCSRALYAPWIRKAKAVTTGKARSSCASALASLEERAYCTNMRTRKARSAVRLPSQNLSANHKEPLNSVQEAQEDYDDLPPKSKASSNSGRVVTTLPSASSAKYPPLNRTSGGTQSVLQEHC
jgi:hypothetical protein